MKKTSLLNVLLSLAVAIETVFDLGCRAGQWWRNGGREQSIQSISFVVAAVIWTYETIALGAKVIYRNRHAIMEAAGKPFIYA